MKTASTVLLLIISIHCTSQQLIDIRVGAGTAWDTTSLSNRINSKQGPLVSGVDVKTINSQTLLSPGDLVVTAVATPEANFYGSSYGSNGLAGTLKSTAKKTLPAIDTLVNASTLTTVSVGFQGGSTYKGTDGIVLNRGQVSFTSYDRTQAGKYSFPKFVGTDVFNTGWTLTGSHTYQQAIPNSLTLTVGNYANMPVIEIDTLLEKTQPLTARHYLRAVSTLAAVETTAGSWYCPIGAAASPTTISIHTTDGSSPNNNPRYRYEVVTRDRAINRTAVVGYGNAVSVEKLFAMDYGQGTGPFASRLDSFYMKLCAELGNVIHHMVCGNYSTIDKSAFMGGDPNLNGGSVIFYQTSGANETNTIQNSIFLDNPVDVYTHTGGVGGNHGKLVFKNNYIFNSTSTAIGSANTDTMDINYAYADSCNIFLSTDASVASIKNSIVINTSTLNWHTKTVSISNTLWKSSRAASQGFIVGAGTGDKIVVKNSILHLKNKYPTGVEGGAIFNNADTSARVTATNNIFILEGATGTYMDFAHCNTWAGAGTGPDVFDYNVYILVRGIPRWWVSNQATNGGVTYINGSFATWKTQSGQDSHSIFIDLTAYENDLKRIFVNPDAGNYHLTESPQADSIRAILGGAGMLTPPGTFASTPSREQVLDIVENDKFVPVSQLIMTGNGTVGNYETVERLTTAQRNAIPTPIREGRQVYDTDLHKRYEYNGTSWNALW